MSKKARRRPSWGKYRQKYGMWVERYQKTRYTFNEDTLKKIMKDLDEIFKANEPHKIIAARPLMESLFYGQSFYKSHKDGTVEHIPICDVYWRE